MEVPEEVSGGEARNGVGVKGGSGYGGWWCSVVIWVGDGELIRREREMGWSEICPPS